MFTWDKLGFLPETAMMRVVDLSSLVEQAKEITSCVGRTLAYLALTAALAFGASSASASEPLVRRISIIEHGIYVSETTGTAAAVGTLGIVQRVRAPRLVENTTVIPGRRSVRFGVRYLVRGLPLGAEAEIRCITKFPADIATGVERLPLSEYRIRVPVGSVAYREFIFDHDEEIVPGEWIFEFWHRRKKLGEQKFCVYRLDGPLANRRGECSSAIALSR